MLRNTRRVNRSKRSQPETLPAPVGGLNGRDGLADMPPLDAFVLDNFFPNRSTVDTRLGSRDYAGGTTGASAAGAIESLEVFKGGSGRKLLAFGDGKVFNVTAGGAFPAPLASAKLSNKISSVMFSNAGAQYLLGVSGADAPFSYDGTTFNTLVITGLTGVQTDLHGIHVFKGRVFLAQKDQLGFYYLAVGAIQGAASYFDLSQQCLRGGYLLGMASVSQNSGNGPADYCIFMTSEGEYLMYAGTDPSNVATWSLVGRFYAAPPIGRKGWFNFRSDLHIICEDGIVPFAQICSEGEDSADNKYLSDKLGKIYTDMSINQTVHGWSGLVYPRSNMLVVNCPASSAASGNYYQFAMNTNTGAWGRFTGLNGLCWTVFNRRLYFGTTDGRVVLADDGTSDNGADIKCDARQAYNYFDDGKGRGGADKQFHFATFVLNAEGAPAVAAELDVNFEDDPPDPVGSLTVQAGGIWDVAEWDVADWGGDGVTQNFTVPFGKLGYAASIWFRTALSGTQIKWYSTRLVMEKAQGIVLL